MISFLRKYNLSSENGNAKALNKKLLLLSDLDLFESARGGLIAFYCLIVSRHVLKMVVCICAVKKKGKSIENK